MTPSLKSPRGRPARLPIGTLVLVAPSGFDDTAALLAKVVHNTHRLVVEIIEPHAVFHGCRMHDGQCRVLRVESLPEGYLA